MRKGVINLLEKAKQYDLPEEYIKFIEESTYTIKELNRIFWYLYEINKKGLNTPIDILKQNFEKYPYQGAMGYGHLIHILGYENFALKDIIYQDSFELYKLCENFHNLYYGVVDLYAKLLVVANKDEAYPFIKYLISKTGDIPDNTQYLAWFLKTIVSNPYVGFYLNHEKSIKFHYNEESVQILLKDFANVGWKESFLKYMFDHGIVVVNLNYVQAEDELSLKKNFINNLEANKYSLSNYDLKLNEDNIKKLNYYNINILAMDYRTNNEFYDSILHFIKQKIKNPQIHINKEIQLVDYDNACSSLIKMGITGNIRKSHYSLFIRFRENKNINIVIKTYDNTYIGEAEDGTEKICGCGSCKIENLIFTSDGCIFINKGNKYIPITVKKLFELNSNKLFREMMNIYYNNMNSNFLKDLLNDYTEVDNFLLPIRFNDIKQYHNKKEYMINHYKNANSLRIDYNKININLSYMILKSARYISDDSMGILQNLREFELLNGIEHVGRRCDNSVKTFLTNYYLIIKDFDIDLSGVIKDYIGMCQIDKRKISLRYSQNRLLEMHNYYMDHADYYELMRKTEKVKIKEESKFLDLREILPDDFEWIKTKRRLAKEALIMHHCVWSYANRINRDSCTIYSYVDKEGEFGEEGKRYTIEFGKSHNKYIINQIQSKYDKGCPAKFRHYVQSLIGG